MTDEEHARAGFVQRWVLPIAFIACVVVVFGFVGRMSMPVLGPDSEMPESHLRGACPVCHRSEPGFDPATLLDE